MRTEEIFRVFLFLMLVVATAISFFVSFHLYDERAFLIGQLSGILKTTHSKGPLIVMFKAEKRIFMDTQIYPAMDLNQPVTVSSDGSVLSYSNKSLIGKLSVIIVSNKKDGLIEYLREVLGEGFKCLAIEKNGYGKVLSLSELGQRDLPNNLVIMRGISWLELFLSPEGQREWFFSFFLSLGLSGFGVFVGLTDTPSNVRIPHGYTSAWGFGSILVLLSFSLPVFLGFQLLWLIESIIDWVFGA